MVSIMGGYVCKIVCQFFGLCSVCCWVCQIFAWWLYLELDLSVSWGLILVLGFLCFWAGKYVIMPFKSREGVSVGLFY